MGYASPSQIPFWAKDKDASETQGGQKFLNYFKTLSTPPRRRSVISKKSLFCGSLLFFTTLGFFHIQHQISSSEYTEIDATINFTYPYYAPNFEDIVTKLRYGKKTEKHPTNLKYSRIPFVKQPVSKSESQNLTPHGILIIVKSAVQNFDKRSSIRRSWGNVSYLKDTQLSPKLPNKLAFICGVPAEEDQMSSNALEMLYQDEKEHKDIIIANFMDTYANNTYKTVLALKWAVENYGQNFEYVLLVDDDLYIDLDNLVKYIQSFSSRQFIRVFQEDGKSFPYFQHSTIYGTNNLVTGKEILRHGLYMGNLRGTSRPIRPSLSTMWRLEGKWHVSMNDYPYNVFPSYPLGAGILLSNEAVFRMYFASFYVQHFWIDDVYLGILAFKMGITPVSNPHFLVMHPERDDIYGIGHEALAEVIALHGTRCPWEMYKIWTYRNISVKFNCEEP